MIGISQDDVIRMPVMQGDARASSDPRVLLHTILGSCVATCLYDPVAKVGGMNHFLLAEPPDHTRGPNVDRDYGLYLMELLINEMLKQGACKSRMRARLYGGANMHAKLGTIGTSNAAFARKFLRDERIELMLEDMEGTSARRVEFRPASGQLRARHIARSDAPPVTKEKPQGRPKESVGSVELF